tara:strand:- start:8427 stop:8555 length:129 start_codon:yes stop_codon:yes gene_type:complete
MDSNALRNNKFLKFFIFCDLIAFENLLLPSQFMQFLMNSDFF